MCSKAKGAELLELHVEFLSLAVEPSQGKRRWKTAPTAPAFTPFPPHKPRSAEEEVGLHIYSSCCSRAVLLHAAPL